MDWSTFLECLKAAGLLLAVYAGLMFLILIWDGASREF